MHCTPAGHGSQSLCDCHSAQIKLHPLLLSKSHVSNVLPLCRSLTTVRVMVISRGAFESIERSFPIASRLVLENLRRRSEAQVALEFPGIGDNRAELQQLLTGCPSSLMYSWASPELVRS